MAHSPAVSRRRGVFAQKISRRTYKGGEEVAYFLL